VEVWEVGAGCGWLFLLGLGGWFKGVAPAYRAARDKLVGRAQSQGGAAVTGEGCFL